MHSIGLIVLLSPFRYLTFECALIPHESWPIQWVMSIRDFLSDSPGSPLFVLERYHGGVLHVKFVGPSVGQREAPIITEAVSKAIQEHEHDLHAVVVDLSDVRMLCSMGLGSIIDIRNRAKKVGAKSILFGMRPEVEGLVKIVRIERLYKIARSAAEVEKLAA